MDKYALTKGLEIIKFKKVPDGDTLLVSKLVAHGYILVEEQNIPSIDSSTQTLSDRYEVQSNKVVHVWDISDIPYIEAQQMKTNLINQNALSLISDAFGKIDQSQLIVQILQDKDNAISLIGSSKSTKDVANIII